MFTKAVEQGVLSLLRGQSLDGAWRDFRLEPGESDSWVTAYVGSCLLQVFSAGVSSWRQSVVSRASEWLRSVMRTDGTWGYNQNCPIDSDSTAHAVLFLSECGNAVPDDCFTRLLRFQKTDGGFATFEPQSSTDSWGASHPDVSPIVLRALLTRLSSADPALRQGIDYILSQLQPNGLWRSFWWTTPLYSTLSNIRLLEQTRTLYNRAQILQAIQSIPVPQDPFRAALLGEILAILDPGSLRAGQVGRALVESQHSDGSWHASSPILRVTDPRCFTPWIPDVYVGYAASDTHHLFTTATVLRCLAAMSLRA